MSKSFTDLLLTRSKKLNTPVLMGLDPRESSIPDDCFPSGRDSVEKVAEGFYRFGTRLLEALKNEIVAVKPQIAFYEALGLPGLQAYANTLHKAQSLGIPCIADIKRGDIGSTAEAYACAHLSGPEGEDAPFGADAVTLNPWLGGDSLEPFFRRCRNHGKGVYLLLHTSNPGSVDIQEQEAPGHQKVYQHLADLILRWQEQWDGDALDNSWSSIGAVVGATWPEQLIELKQRLPRTPFLVPGYGSQGGSGRDVAPLFESGPTPHLVNASRSLTYAWQKNGGGLEEAALAACKAMKADILEQGGV